MRDLTVEDVEDLALGAVVLGTGGGGDPHIGKPMPPRALERHVA
ncbi:S-methyl thiohydantoin desulfurase domain-containing protein [Streptomyces sp. NPDC004726]